MTKKPVMILGGRSDIGLAIAHRFAQAGYPVQLAARNAETLNTEKSDIQLRYQTSVSLHEFDALDTASHKQFTADLTTQPGIVVCVVGLLGDQTENEHDIAAATLVMRSNYEGPVSIMGMFANQFEEQGSGILVGVSSVAGERGRATNYIYGSAKAGFTAFLSGLRNRLASKGVHVITAKPGFVATRMIEGMDTPALLTAQPAEVAEAIFNAVRKKQSVIYVKPIWMVVMWVIRHLPESVFKRLKL